MQKQITERKGVVSKLETLICFLGNGVSKITVPVAHNLKSTVHSKP